MKPLNEVLNEDDYIQEGVNPAPGVLALCCTTGDNYDNQKNRILLLKDNSWLEFGISGDSVQSIDAASDGMAYVLTASGAVVQFDWRNSSDNASLKASRRLFPNKIAAELGPLRRIRLLGKDLICAGSRGQAYRVSGGVFDPLPRLSFGGEELTIESFSGTAVSNLFAVTTDGYAAHFDGSAWHHVDLPCSAGLNGVCMLSDGDFAIGGYNSTLLIGRDDGWRVLEPIDQNRNYYGVAGSGKEVFFAHLGGIDVFDGSELAPLPIAGDANLEFVILRGGPDGVWSFAGHTVGVVSATGWRRFE